MDTTTCSGPHILIRHSADDDIGATRPRDVGFDPDDPDSAFRLLEQGFAEGIPGALVTVTGVTGGAPRALGTHMAVLADGRYCGHVSGGCIEAAVAAETVAALADGTSRRLRFGLGSPFIDVRLPCGGGLDVDVHVGLPASLLAEARARLRARRTFSLVFRGIGDVHLGPSRPDERSSVASSAFVRHYHPTTRLILVGEGPELIALATVARATRLSVDVILTAPRGIEELSAAGAAVWTVSKRAFATVPVDPFTAIVVMLHDRFKEAPALDWALRTSEPFYIGALGSTRTHEARLERLAMAGFTAEQLRRLRGPIGLFGPARAAMPLAVSVLAEVMQARDNLDCNGLGGP